MLKLAQYVTGRLEFFSSFIVKIPCFKPLLHEEEFIIYSKKMPILLILYWLSCSELNHCHQLIFQVIAF